MFGSAEPPRQGTPSPSTACSSFSWGPECEVSFHVPRSPSSQSDVRSSVPQPCLGCGLRGPLRRFLPDSSILYPRQNISLIPEFFWPVSLLSVFPD